MPMKKQRRSAVNRQTRSSVSGSSLLIVPTLSVGMPPWTLRVPMCASISSPAQGDAERHRMYSHAERGNDQCQAGWLGL
ncbi:UNVERIFIED_ORG: hypothetical protein J3D59_004911 [Pseudomonas fluorescens]